MKSISIFVALFLSNIFSSVIVVNASDLVKKLAHNKHQKTKSSMKYLAQNQYRFASPVLDSAAQYAINDKIKSQDEIISKQQILIENLSKQVGYANSLLTYFYRIVPEIQRNKEEVDQRLKEVDQRLEVQKSGITALNQKFSIDIHTVLKVVDYYVKDTDDKLEKLEEKALNAILEEKALNAIDDLRADFEPDSLLTANCNNLPEKFEYKLAPSLSYSHELLDLDSISLSSDFCLEDVSSISSCNNTLSSSSAASSKMSVDVISPSLLLRKDNKRKASSINLNPKNKKKDLIRKTNKSSKVLSNSKTIK